MLTAKSDTVDVVLGLSRAPTTTWSNRSSQKELVADPGRVRRRPKPASSSHR
ncbi:hypothetical protein HBB16_11905 [Pseudonocardia sp. MCCB 268]|nr:hypothetical protein [Pseudonocardia cytotoxica]